MGKISDLWVRLGLKKEEFDKGMNDVDKRTEKTGSVLGRLKNIGVAVWAAIGGAVLKVGKDITKSTNEMEDKWEIFTTKAKVAWNTFVRTLVSGDWSNFISNFKREVQAVTHLQEILQADTEIMNAIAIQKAQIANQLAELEIAMRDQTKLYEERAAAAQKYIKLVTPIYDKEIQRAEKLKAAQYKAFFGNKYADSTYTNKANQALWDMMLVEYGNLDPVINGRTFNEIVARYLNPDDYITPFSESEVKHQLEFNAIQNEFNQLAEWLTNAFNQKYAGQFTTNADDVFGFMSTFFNQYEKNRNSEEVQALFDAVIGLYNAIAARKQETKRVENTLNGIEAALLKEKEDLGVAFVDDLDEIISEPIEIEIEPIEIDMDSADEALDKFLDDWREKMAEAEKIAEMFNSAITRSISDGTTALIDGLMNADDANPAAILSAIVSPFADLMTQLGEMLVAEGIAIEASKLSLRSLNGIPAIAAGTALIATAAAIKGGIQKLGNVGGESAAAVGSSSSSTGSVENIQSELTIYVEGRLSGSDIVLAGNKTLKNWGR